MGTADKVLKEQVEKAIGKLEDSSAEDARCKAHAPLAEGVKVLLEIQKARLEGVIEEKNTLRLGNITVSGMGAIGLITGVASLLKVFDVI